MLNRNFAVRDYRKNADSRKARYRRLVEAGIDEEKAVEFAKKLKSGKGFDLNDFKEQIAQMRNMGGLTAMMDKMPAQIAQMVQQNRQSKGAGDIAYNFTHDNKIKRVYVSAAVQAHLAAGRLVIVCQGDTTDLVPKLIADKIAERDPSLVVRVNKATTEIDADDPYAAFRVPDDLMW